MVEEPSTSFDELMVGYLAFVMQDLNRREDCLVSRHSVLMFFILSTFVHHLAQLQWPGMSLGDDEVCVTTLCYQGLVCLSP